MGVKNFLEKFDHGLNTGLRIICGILMFAMMVIIFSQVIARYAFNRSLSWSEEVGRYIFVWISFLGLAAAYKQGAHVALDLLLKSLKGAARRTLEMVNIVLIIVLSSAIIISGFKLFQVGMRQKSTALKLPMHWVFIVVPVCGILLLYFSLRNLGVLLAKKDKGEQTI
jgi:TRAP-type C4-dicarboxylate transport system permease small subunit